jgi:glyceraldehyde 3-phosphate dehydrogenase
LNQAATVEAVNAELKRAADEELKGILGFEERPLVSSDFVGDSRSSVVDALSTMIIDKTQLKLYLWYDNEWGYANRVIELADYICQQ